jgi:hypothetical protein
MKIFKSYVLFLLFLICTGEAMAIEEPKYEVLQSESAFELRKYAPILVAETLVEGDMDQASSKGFRLIADFIFGNNQAPKALDKAGSEKIAMTAPVISEPLSTKIAMTAPVTIEPQNSQSGQAGQDSGADMQSAEKWLIKFVMPSQYTLASIPKPKNSAVTLKEVPGKTYVVLKYSGFNGASKVQSMTLQAIEWANTHQLKIIGTPQLARYDPPWTLPMLRRNEIMVEVAPNSQQ